MALRSKRILSVRRGKFRWLADRRTIPKHSIAYLLNGMLVATIDRTVVDYHFPKSVQCAKILQMQTQFSLLYLSNMRTWMGVSGASSFGSHAAAVRARGKLQDSWCTSRSA